MGYGRAIWRPLPHSLGWIPQGSSKQPRIQASLLSDTRCFSLPETYPSPLVVSLRSAVLLLLWLDKCSACILFYFIRVSVGSSLTLYWCWFPRQRSSPQPFSPCPCKVTASRDVSTQLSSILFLATKFYCCKVWLLLHCELNFKMKPRLFISWMSPCLRPG